VRRFCLDGAGATAIEYAMIAALISIVIVTAVTQIGQNVNSFFTQMIAPFV
jgi:pilus assembly protein Flp/PilA